MGERARRLHRDPLVSRRFAAVMVLLTSGCAYALTSRSADEAAIKAQLAGYAEAHRNGDGLTQALFYAEDADQWGGLAREMTKGRAGIARILSQPPDPNRVFRLEMVSVSFLGANVGLADAFFYSSTSPAPTGHALYVMVKRQGRWLIRSARVTRFPLPAAK